MNTTEILTKSTNSLKNAACKPLFPFLDLKAEYATMKQELLAALENVLEHQHFIMGPEVSKLETEVAALIGCGFALGCASGSDARHPKYSNAKFLSEQNGLVLKTNGNWAKQMLETFPAAKSA